MPGYAVVEFTVFLLSFTVQLFLNCWLDRTRSGCRYTPGARVTTPQLAMEHPDAVQAECQITAVYAQQGIMKGGNIGGCVFIYAQLTWVTEPPDLLWACQSADPLHKVSPGTTGAGQWCMLVKMHLSFSCNRCVCCLPNAFLLINLPL